MAQGDRTFTVILELHNGVLEENLTFEEEDNQNRKQKKSHKKVQKRDTKKEFRDLMKDPSKFEFSEIADPDHPTIVVRDGQGNDQVVFYCFEGFKILFRPHPDVIEEFLDTPDGPLKKNNVVVTSDTAVNNPGGGPDKVFVAGPYQVAGNAKKQKFWKFMVVTTNGHTLDPCIITE